MGLIDEYIEQLDLEVLGFTKAAPGNGKAAIYPKDMLKLYIYGYLNRDPFITKA